MKIAFKYLRYLFVSTMLLFFIGIIFYMFGSIIKSEIEYYNPGKWKDKNDFYYACENRPELYRNNFGEYCREGGVNYEWVIQNTYKYFDGELYVMYSVPENAIYQNFEFKGHGESMTIDLDDQVRFYEIGWVHAEDVKNQSCGSSRVKDINTYKRFL